MIISGASPAAAEKAISGDAIIVTIDGETGIIISTPKQMTAVMNMVSGAGRLSAGISVLIQWLTPLDTIAPPKESTVAIRKYDVQLISET